MKTPEEMAEEWAKAWRYEGVCHFALGNLRLCEYAQNEVQRRLSCGFLAGYKAAENHFRDVTEKVGPQWISVKDRLPEEDREVLVVLNGESCKDVHVSWYEGGEFGWATLGFVTHWMELPAPPKEEK